MDQTVEKYKQYVITGFVKNVEPVVFDSAQDAVIIDTTGREFIDCFSGISVTNAGHSNREVVKAASAQIEKFVHCCSYVYHSPPTADLAEKLAQITPGQLKKTFFASSGAAALEGALRLAKLYTGKREFIALQLSFHGRSLATLSLTGNSGRKRSGGPFMPGISFAPVPYTYRSPFGKDPTECSERCVQYLRDVIRFDTSGDVAALIAEPILGEGGIIVPPQGFFRAVKEVLDEHGILFIADEVQTGFARTGRMFAIEHYGVEPDILVTAKGIANGFPLGGFTTRDEIAAAFRPGDHLSTFGGNPVSCAAAFANIEFIENEGLCEQAAIKGEYVLNKLLGLQQRFPIIGEVRGKGLMIGAELVLDDALTPATGEAAAIKSRCLEKGVLLGVGGAYGNVLRLQPPLVITQEQLDSVLNVIEQSLQEVSRSLEASNDDGPMVRAG